MTLLWGCVILIFIRRQEIIYIWYDAILFTGIHPHETSILKIASPTVVCGFIYFLQKLSYYLGFQNRSQRTKEVQDLRVGGARR